MTPEDLLEKQRQLKERLALAGQQVETLEQLANSRHRIDKNAFQFARAEFNRLIPNGNEPFGCKSTCPLGCRCSEHLFRPEKLQRHELYMRYFAAKDAAEKFISEVEQTSFALPAAIRRSETAHKRMSSKPKALEHEVNQLGLVF